jgi:hypothetical protein
VRQGVEHAVRDSIAPIYTHGDAGLSVVDQQKILSRAAAQVDHVLPEERIRQLVSEGLQRAAEVEAARAAGRELPQDQEDPMAAIGEETKNAVRASLRKSLAAVDLPERQKNAVLARLEWHITYYDFSDDLGDDSFRVNVTLPGTIVSGNFARVAGNRAIWDFKGERLRLGDVVLEVTSVLE